MSGSKYIGIVGWGSYTELLARTYHFETKGAEVLAVATANTAAQVFARDVLGIKHVFSEPRSLYELHQLDAICIESPCEYHVDQVAKCLDAGVDVLLGPPLACNVSDCLAIEKIARSHPSQKVILALPCRFDPTLRQIKHQLAGGAVGKIIAISVEHYESPAADFADGNYSLSKGIFMDITLTDIDLVRWLTEAEFTEVFARGSASKYDFLKTHGDADTAFVSSMLDDGTLVQFLSTRTGVSADRLVIHIMGTTGTIKYASPQPAADLVTDRGREVIASVQDSSATSHMLRSFYELIGTREKLPFTVADGTEATKVAVAMTKSFVLGGPINIID